MFPMRRLLPLFLAACLSPVFGTTATANAETVSATTKACLLSLAHVPGEEEEAESGEGLEAALQCLINESAKRTDTAFKPLFAGLSTGSVLIANLPGAPSSLVIAGESVDREDGTYYPVHLAYPFTGEDITGPDGKPLLILSDSLIEPDIGRAERALIQPVLTTFDLFSADPATRRSASSLLGETRDLNFLPALQKAIAAEPDKRICHVMLESQARLELYASDKATRLAACEALGELKGLAALSDLETIAGNENEPFVLRDAAATAIKSIKAWSKFTGILQNIFSGLSLGSILILMALGLAVIFGLMGVINMAHGEFMMIGAYATFMVQVFFQAWLPGLQGWFLAFSFPVAFLTAGLAGMLIEATIIKRLYGRPLETLLATWGVSLLLIQIARTIFGDLTAVTTPPFLGGGWEVFPQVVFPFNRLFIIVLTAVIVTGMTLLFFHTALGMKVRAVTQNRAMSACLGVRTRRLDNITFGIGTGIAGLAGCALTQIGNVDPGMGQNYIVDSFMVVVTGGVGKLVGTVLAGLGIGTLNKFLEPFFQAVYAKVILLGLVILFLQWRPSGLFPAKGRHEDN
jgi:urea transport system permease protein